MKLFQRFAYYGIGLFIGSIFVWFIWTKKDVQFDYMPNARILKNIRVKNPVFSSDVLKYIHSKEIDSSTIAQVLKNGNVHIWDKVKLDSCIRYDINGRKEFKNITLTILNCKSSALIEKVSVE